MKLIFSTFFVLGLAYGSVASAEPATATFRNDEKSSIPPSCAIDPVNPDELPEDCETRASLSYQCKGFKIKLSTGTDRGTCEKGSCSDENGKIVAYGNCEQGCLFTSGSGSCKYSGDVADSDLPLTNPTQEGETRASIDLKCGDKIYHLSTGTKGGTCAQSVTNKDAVCSDTDVSSSAKASCSEGCIKTTGAGSCS